MSAKTLRKQFKTVLAYNTNLFKNGIFDTIRILGFHAIKQDGDKLEHFRVVHYNKRYIYLVPEMEFRRSF